MIVGDGPLRGEVERLMTQLELGKRLHLCGLRDDVEEILAVSDVVCLSSLWEGLPRLIPEAMAAEKPAVSETIMLIKPNDGPYVSRR